MGRNGYWTASGAKLLMLYNAYELQRFWFAGASAWADASAEWLNNPHNPLSYSTMGPVVASALDVFAHASAPRGKQKVGFEAVTIGGIEYPAEEETVELERASGRDRGCEDGWIGEGSEDVNKKTKETEKDEN